ncbi:MAG: signal peptidase I [Erysipelothrix sp.]|nr:signal peptidase I [Erysipelothrix sp.]
MRTRKILNELISFLKVLILSYISIFLLTTFVLKPVIVTGTSMEPTLKDKDIGFSYIITKNLFGVKRGAVVTVYVEADDQYLVKRVIGLPGETIYAKNSIIYINDEPIVENYLDKDFMKTSLGDSNRNFTDDFEKLKIPADHYFLMGDNRPRSKDSREYGPFNYDQIMSNSLLVIYPFEDFGMK